jgi:hypothetical protein
MNPSNYGEIKTFFKFVISLMFESKTIYRQVIQLYDINVMYKNMYVLRLHFNSFGTYS